MSLYYLYRCDRCGANMKSEPLEVSLTSEVAPWGGMFVHDVGWEDLPEKWTFQGDLILCPREETE